jgi:hypothetical protein
MTENSTSGDHMTLLDAAQFGAEPLPLDNRNHTPTNDKWWQESVLFTWGDAACSFGGEIRLGIHPNQGAANLYAWVMLNGEMIVRRFFVDLPLPPGDLLDTSLAAVIVRTIVPLSRYRLCLRLDGLTLELVWRNFHHPLSMSFNLGGATIANGHYNAMGELKGIGSYRGQEIEVNSVGFSDHSWGVRKSHLPASRSLFCVFGEDFYITAIPISTGAARAMVGYVMKDGLLGRLSSQSEMGYSFRDDWLTPAGCNADLIDEDGRKFRVTGHTIGPSSTQPLGHGKFVTHATANFICDGRQGSGILESSQFKGIPPGVTALGIDPNSWWVSDH